MTSNEKTVLEEIRDLLLEGNRLLTQIVEKPKECKSTECKTEKPKFGKKKERSAECQEAYSIVNLVKANVGARWGAVYKELGKRLGIDIKVESIKEGYECRLDYIEAHKYTNAMLAIAKELFADDIAVSLL